MARDILLVISASSNQSADYLAPKIAELISAHNAERDAEMERLVGQMRRGAQSSRKHQLRADQAEADLKEMRDCLGRCNEELKNMMGVCVSLSEQQAMENNWWKEPHAKAEEVVQRAATALLGEKK